MTPLSGTGQTILSPEAEHDEAIKVWPLAIVTERNNTKIQKERTNNSRYVGHYEAVWNKLLYQIWFDQICYDNE